MKIGLYSLSMNVPFSTLMEFADDQRMPFVHLRVGKRGYEVAEVRSALERRSWTTPITLLCVSVDIEDILQSESTAVSEFTSAIWLARKLGVKRVRILSRLSSAEWPNAQFDVDAYTASDIRLLIEPHHCQSFSDFETNSISIPASIGILLDSAHLIDAEQVISDGDREELFRRTEIWHLHLDESTKSDDIDAFLRTFHRIKNAYNNKPHELALEWTGQNRSGDIIDEKLNTLRSRLRLLHGRKAHAAVDHCHKLS